MRRSLSPFHFGLVLRLSLKEVPGFEPLVIGILQIPTMGSFMISFFQSLGPNENNHRLKEGEG